MKKSLLIISLFFFSTLLLAQDYYWVGGSGNWSDFANHWATESGGSTFHTQAPTSSDHVFFDANSFTAAGQVVTLESNGVCADMTWSGVLNSPNFTVNSGIDLQIYGSLLLDENATYDLREIQFLSTSSGETINTSGVDLGQYCDFTFEGSGEWTIASDVTTREAKLLNGTVNFSSYKFTASNKFDIRASAGATTLNLQDAVIEVGHWETRFGSNFTISEGNSTIVLRGCCFTQRFYGKGETYHNLEIPVGTNYIFDSNTFNKITIGAGTSVEFEAGETQTFSELEATGTSSETINLTSDEEGVQSTLTLQSGGVAVEAYFLEIRDIAATGESAFEALQSVDNGNNSGWNITAVAGQDYYWVGGSGSWSDLNNWATASGGSTFYGELPTINDNVIFDANSFSATDQAVVLDVVGACHDFNWSVISFNVSLEEGDEHEVQINGSVALSNLVRIGNDVDLKLISADSETFSMGDDPEVRKGIDANRTVISFEGDGTWTVQDHITTEGSVWVEGNATLNLDGNPLWTREVSLGANSTFTSGASSSITFEDWFCSTGNVTFGADTEFTNIQFSEFDDNANFWGGDNSYPDLTISNSGQTFILNESNQFESFSVEAGSTISFEAGETQTITDLLVEGTKFELVTMTSSDDGNQATISVGGGGTVTLSYLALKDMIATGGASFDALSSIDNGNNTGWTITAPVSDDYFWIGDGGSWEDLNHWSTSSGGVELHTSLPGSIDNIFFDANSFSLDDQEVAASGEVSIDNLDFSAVTNSPSLNVSTFNLNGSLTLGPGVTTNGTITLNSEGSETITSNGANGINGLSFASAGTYTLTDDLHVDNISLDNGATFIIDDREVTFVSFALTNSGTLSATNAMINSTSFQTSGNVSLSMSGSTLSIRELTRLNGSMASFPGFGAAFNSSSPIAYADLILDDVVDIIYNQEVSFDQITIQPGAEAVFKDLGTSTTITINDLVANGTSDELIIIKSFESGTPHIIESGSGNEVNATWVELSDSQVSGATFNADDSFDNGNNIGWNIVAPPDAPSSPENLIASDITASSFTASWDEVENADSYRLDLARDSGFGVTVLEDEEVSGTSFSATELRDAEEYYWRVRSVNSGGTSSNSATEVTLTLPETPVATEAESVFPNKFTARWESVDGADNYRIDVSESDDFSTFLGEFEDLVVSGTSVEVPDLAAGTTYYFRVRAENSSGQTPNSNTISVITSDKLEQVIVFDLGDDAVKQTTDEDFTLSASASSGLTVYFQSSDEAVATVVGNLVSITGAGSTTLTAFQDGDENYNAAEPTAQLLTVGKTAQTITFDPDPIPDQNLSAGSLELTISTDSGLPISASITSGEATIAPSGVSDDVYVVTFTNAGNVTVQAEQAGDDSYAPAVKDISFTVMDDVLDDQEITFSLGDDAVKTFGDEPFTLSATASSGLSVTFNSSDESVALVSGNTVTIIGAGSCSITASQNGDETYNPASSVSETLTVNKAAQTILFQEPGTKAFGDEPFDLAATASSGLEVNYEIENAFIASISAGILTILSAGTTTITATQVGDENFEPAKSVERELVIEKAGQTISFNPTEIPEKVVLDEPFEIEITNSTGLTLDVVGNELVAVTETELENQYQVSLIAPGMAMITATQGGTTNYESAESFISFDIRKAGQVITFSTIEEKTFGDELFILEASSDSGLEIMYASSDETVASVDGNEVTIVGAGTTTITASQSGDDFYDAATAVSQTLIINKANQVITFNDLSPRTFGEDPFDLAATSSSGLPITYTNSDESVALISEEQLIIMGAGTTMISASQQGNENYNEAEDIQQMLTVNKAGQTITLVELPSKTFGDDSFLLAGSSTSGLEVTFSSANESVATVDGDEVTIRGAGEAVITASQVGNENFLAANVVERTLTISKATQNISIDPIEDKNANDDPFEIVAQSDSGLPLTFDVTGPATINQQTITLSGVAGTVNVVANQEGDQNYLASTSSESFEVLETVLGVTQELEVSIYPVPAKDYLIIESPKPVKVRILGLSGVVFLKQQHSSRQLGIDFLKPGIYLLELSYDGDSKTMRFLKN